MKTYKGPKYQGGWVGIAVSVAGAVMDNYQKQKQAKEAKKDSQEMSKEGFARQTWLDQQSRKWQLEDRQRTEQNIAQFRPLGESYGQFFGNMAPPTQTSTEGLADWNPNTGHVPGTPLMYDKKGKAIG